MDSFKSLQDSISAALVSTTRSATRISSADIPFQRSLNPEVGTALDAQNVRLLHLAQRLLETAAASSDATGPKLPDAEAIDSNWRGVIDVIDSLLEKADTSLDEFTGVVKRVSPSGEQAAVKPRPNLAVQKHMPKPQLSFENVPQNNETGGFRPLMTSKPHAKVPLANCLETFRDSHGREQYQHPYQAEIESYEYPSSMYEESQPQPYQPFESTSAAFVDTLEALDTMLAELKTAKEIAIDLEHHDNRSYIGIVSLMQISTRDKDWIIDTLKPWRRKLERLNEVFADPNIIKVLHGSYMDIIWLQRDLGLYVVGLFDTYHAARALGYPGASLAFLLDKFVHFKAQKQYQIADWRTRPLTNELFEYARADTHFLLYIFDNMRNELVAKSDFSNPEKNKVHDVLNKSKETTLQRYEHPIYDAELGLGPVGWYRLLLRTPANFTRQQFSIFRAVHKWRDDVARQEDESPLFIMPNHAVFSIARSMPSEKAALFNVIQHVSPILRMRADELVGIVQQAKLEGIDGPELKDTLKKIEETQDPKRTDAISGANVATSTPMPTIQQAPFVSILDTPPLRAPASQFWGKLWTGGSVEQTRLTSTIKIDLALPLPPLTAEIYTDKNGHVEVASPQTERPHHAFIPKEERAEDDERTDIFVIKSLGVGRKRKRTEPVEESSSAPVLDPMLDDEVMLEEEDSEAVRKAEEKAARKAAKKQNKKKGRANQSSDPLNYDDEPAFDYANAPSILRAQEAESKKKKDKKDKKKKDVGFNPYSKLMDAPKGLPRAQKESAGRSRTFTS